MPALVEKERFKQDTHQQSRDKNQALATLLTTTWNGYDIVRIDRIEIGSVQGWRVIYRE